MERVGSRIALAFILAGSSIGIIAAQGPQVWPREVLERFPTLQRMVQAFTSLRFAGVREVEVRVAGERRRHTEIVLRDGPRQRVEFGADSPLAGRIVVETPAGRREFDPAANEIRVTPGRQSELIAGLRRTFAEAAAGRLTIRREDGGQVAGIRTERYTFLDRDGNPVQRLWVDPRTGMLLKRELIDPVGTVLGSFEYTRITFEPRFRGSDFRIVRRGARIVTPQAQLERIARRLGVPLATLPPSAGVELAEVRVIEGAGRRAVMQIFTSEEGRISLFQLPSGSVDEFRLERLAGEGTSTYRWSWEGAVLVLIGNAPRARLEALARSVMRVGRSESPPGPLRHNR